MVEPEKYLRAYKMKSNYDFLVIENYKTYKTRIKTIILRINKVGQTMHKTP